MKKIKNVFIVLLLFSIVFNIYFIKKGREWIEYDKTMRRVLKGLRKSIEKKNKRIIKYKRLIDRHRVKIEKIDKERVRMKKENEKIMKELREFKIKKIEDIKDFNECKAEYLRLNLSYIKAMDLIEKQKGEIRMNEEKAEELGRINLVLDDIIKEKEGIINELYKENEIIKGAVDRCRKRLKIEKTKNVLKKGIVGVGIGVLSGIILYKVIK